MRKKVSRLLLYVALCTVCAVTKAQNVSKSFENQSLKSVLTEIEHQTGLSIIYELKEVDETKKITGYFKNTPVEQVLSEILDKDLIIHAFGRVSAEVLVFPAFGFKPLLYVLFQCVSGMVGADSYCFHNNYFLYAPIG